MLHVNKDAEPEPSPREQQQQGGVHIFRHPHHLRCSTATPAATGKEWVVRTYSIRWWQRIDSAAARAGTGVRERATRKVACMHPLPQQLKQGRGRVRPAHHTWGIPLLLLFVYCWSWSGSTYGANYALLVLGDSVSVGFGGGCPNACSGHGYCTDPSTETCTCQQGWAGGDCSIRLCPSGTAWVDYATGDNIAHAALTECSNMGLCDRATGRCTCRSGFSGEACQRIECPSDCNGQGRCMSMREAAALIDGDNLEFEGEYDGWDADMIHGCVCDEGWEGYDCSLRTCPKGIDPYPSIVGLDEEQLIDCSCPGFCTGSLLLAFRGHSTRPIPFDSSAALVKYRLEELDTVDMVSVTISGGDGDMVCSGDSGATTRVAFLLQHGPLSDMTADVGTLASTTGTPSIAVIAKDQASILDPSLWSQTGTKSEEECSARGHCNRQTGHCMCYSKFRSSDGRGGEGDLGDCGYYDPSDPPVDCATAVPVWGTVSALCSGVGTCDMTTFSCICDAGYTGGACERLECDSGVAWFEEATAGDRTGLSVPCSAGGVCNEATGNCTCHDGLFDGEACDLLACPTCNELGTCEDMEHFAATAVVNGEAQQVYTYDLWDATKMRSCSCNRSMAVDTMFSGISTTFRGPYTLADTDSYGFDCSLGRCPTGDNLYTEGVTDIQRVTCTGGSGVFTLIFRDGTTAELGFSTSAGDLEAALEATPWILDVSVTFETGETSACSDLGVDIDIEFLTENGDLPLIKFGADFLRLADGVTPGSITVAKVQTGTREDVECAGHGICQEREGVCDCFVGYQSSDGQGASGERGDCGWRNEYQTALFSGNGIAYDYD